MGMLQAPAPYALRPLQVEDITAVLEIERLSFPSVVRAALYERELTDNDIAHYQGLWENEQLIGYAGYWLMAGEAHISKIAVHPAWRRRRLGELLLLNLLRLACKQDALLATLEVRVSNLAAQQLYAKYRFEHVGRRRRYYHDTGEDALLMTAVFAPDNYCQRLETWCQELLADLATTA
ncbi:MAG: ribosomal protein S18-alanine N-acetyltransferase [Chloroflexota bacterium]